MVHKCCLRKFDANMAAYLNRGLSAGLVASVPKAIRQATKYASARDRTRKKTSSRKRTSSRDPSSWNPPYDDTDSDALVLDSHFSPGQPVWAHIIGFPWWPGRLGGIDDADQEVAGELSCRSQVLIYFFNDRGRSAKVHSCCLKKFDPTLAKQLNRAITGRLMGSVTKAVEQATSYAEDNGWMQKQRSTQKRPGPRPSIKTTKRARYSNEEGSATPSSPADDAAQDPDYGLNSPSHSAERGNPANMFPMAKEEGQMAVTKDLGFPVARKSKAMKNFMKLIEKHQSGMDAYSTMSSEQLIALLRARDLELQARKLLERPPVMDNNFLVAVIVSRDVEIRALSSRSNNPE